MNRLLICCLAALATLYASNSLAIEYRFTKIVDTTTDAPVSRFSQFESPTISGDTVAFLGRYSGGPGIFTGSGGPLTKIIARGEMGPAGPFYKIAGPAISGENVAFLGTIGSDGREESGIFINSGGALTTVAFRGDAAPTGSFNYFGLPLISGNNVAFEGTYRQPPSDSRPGIFMGDGGALTTIVKREDATPSGAIQNFHSPAISGDTVVFLGDVFVVGAPNDFYGIYAGSGGPLSKVIEIGDPAPFGTFGSLRSPSISGDTVAFIGGDANEGGIRGVFTMNSAGVLRTIVDLDDPAPVGSFYGFRRPEVGGGTIALLATYGEDQISTSRDGIFVSASGILTHVISTGNPLFGSTIEAFYLGQFQPELRLDPSGTGNFVFGYKLSDGRSGIAIAAPVPEPGMLALAGTILFATLARPRRGK